MPRNFDIEKLLRWWAIVHDERYGLPDVLWHVGGHFCVLPARSHDGAWDNLFLALEHVRPKLRAYLMNRGYCVQRARNLAEAVNAIESYLVTTATDNQ